MSRSDPGALVASVLVHLMLVASGAWLLTTREAADETPAPLVEIDIAPHSEPGSGVPGVGRSPAEPTQATAPEIEAPPPGAGQRTPRPDAGDPGRGGVRPGERAANLSSSIDPLTLERDAPNHPGRSEVQRLRTSRVRRTLDDRRATPNPMELDFVASGPGARNLRRPVAHTDPSRGGARGGIPVPSGSSPGGDPGDHALLPPGAVARGGEHRPAQGVDAREGQVFRSSAAIVTARPAVVRDRASVPAFDRGRPSDTVDSRQRVAARVAGLMQASTLGGDAPAGVGGDLAPAAPAAGGLRGSGARSAPTGPGLGPDLAADPDMQAFYRRVLTQLDRALAKAFPQWAIAEGRSGLVVFDLTLLEDGRVANVSIVRPSGIDEYDDNVVSIVRNLPSFGRVPPELGPRVVIRMNYDSVNPVVGRSGPGPGRRP